MPNTYALQQPFTPEQEALLSHVVPLPPLTLLECAALKSAAVAVLEDLNPQEFAPMEAAILIRQTHALIQAVAKLDQGRSDLLRKPEGSQVSEPQETGRMQENPYA